MADVNANIGINFETSQALAQLRQLQAGLSRFNQALTQGNVAAMNAQKGLNDQLMQAINATGKFVATQKDVATSTASFTQALEKNQLSMREYFRYTAAAATANTKTFTRMFQSEREIINRARKDRVKLLQSQYIQLGSANGELVKVLQVIPKHLQMVDGKYADYATRVQMAAQRQQFLNQLLKQGSTQLLNFGKNTQWAGRQLMVGLTIPLTMLGSIASKTFLEMEQAVLKFTRVYGDITTSGDATNKALKDIQMLGKEFTKYGIAVKDTVEMAATAAAMGLTGGALNAQVIAATKLAVLGQVEQQQALETTISLQNAFGISSEQLAAKINFLNAVENQTVLSIEDLTIAIPKAGPVVQQLGGNVEDLAFFMTAMKEGGINASEGANALKSGLASLINPSKKSAEFLAKLGINIKGIVNANAGDLKGTVVGFARALDTLDPLNRARAIEQLFGKFQFARLSTLFQNVTKDSSQAARALGLAGASVEELAILSERELAKVEDSTGAKFKKAMENLKNELVPVGKAFLEAITPVVQFAGKVLEKFNGLSEGTKKTITIMIGVIGGLAPIALMTFGLLANGVANLIKFFAMLRGGIAKLNGSNMVLGGGFDYLTNQQIENMAETNALHTSHQQLISTFNLEKSAIDSLAAAYTNASTQARALAASSPGLFNTVPGPAGAVAGLPKPNKYAKGKKADVLTVGGSGDQDTELALLTPGETVISAPMSDKYGGLINAMIDDNVPGYKSSKRAGNPDANWIRSQSLQLSSMSGLPILDLPTSGAVQGGTFNDATYSLDAMMAPGNNASGPGMDLKWLAETEEAQASIVSALKVGQMRAEGVRVEYDNYANFWSEINTELDEIATIFQGQAQGAQSVSDAGARAYPLIIQKIDEMEANFRLSAEDAAKLRVRTRSLLAPTEEDRPASRNRRYDLAIDPATGGEVVKRRGWDSRSTPEGTLSYDPGPAENAYPWELEKRGIDLPENYDKGYQFAHVGDAQVGDEVTKPVTFRKYRQESGPTPGEQRLAEMITAQEDIKVGMQVSTADELASWVDSQITNAEVKAETASPSKRTKRLGKDIADGLAVGLEEGRANVESQSSQLVDAALPTAAETQAKIDKMDLGNKAFYDDINTPEMRDERQVLKSLDRQRRKRGAGGKVGVPSDPTSSSSIVSISTEARSRTQAAADQLAVKTEEAVEAESQVVQHIKDESRARVKIKGNTINIGKAREDADKAESEAATTRERAAALEEEQAKQKKSKSPTTITDEQVLEAKEKANAAELKAAETRAALAMAEAEKSNIDILEDDVKPVGEAQQIINQEAQNQAEVSEGITDSLVNVDETSQVSADALGETSENLVTQTGLSESIAISDAERAQEAQETAATQAKINEAKNAELKAAQENARQEAAAASTPNGSQVNGPMPGEEGFVGPLTASQQANADRAQARLARKQEKALKRGMRKERVGRYSGKVSGALGAATMVAGMTGAPPQVTAALGAMSMVAQMAPMLAGLSGPQGIVAAIVAVGAGLWLLNKHFTASARAQAKFVKDITATTDKMKKIGEFTGTVGASELMAKRREGGFNTGYIPRERKGQEFGITFAEGEIGKQMASSFVTSMEKFGSEEAAKVFGLELAAYVADGVLTAEQAQGIAFAIGSKFKDQNIIVDIEAQLSNIIGMNGEDLSRDPLELRLRLISEGNKQVQREIDAMNNKANNTSVSGADEAARVAAFQVNAITLAQTAADSMTKYYEDEKKVLEEQLKQTKNKQDQITIQTKLNKLIQDAADSEQIMNAQVLKQVDESIALFDSEIRTGNAGMFNDMARRENAYFDSLKQNVRSAYAGTGLEKDADRLLERLAKVSDEAKNQGFETNFEAGTSAFDQGQDFEVRMNLLVANKLISPTQANAFMDLFDGNLKNLQTTLDVGIKSRGAGKTAELLGMMTRFSDKKTAQTMAMNITMEDNATFDRLNNILGLANLLDGKEIDMDIMFGGVSGESRLRVLDEQFKALTDQTDALKDKEITTDFLVNFDAQYGTDTSKADLDFIKQEFAGDKKGQVNALRTYQMISQYVNSIEFDSPEAKKMFEQEAERRLIEGYRNRTNKAQTFEEYRKINFQLLLDEARSDFQLDKDGFIQTRFKALIGTTPKIDSKDGGNQTPGDGTQKKDPLDFLDELAMRIKNVRDGAFDATKPLESMLAAFTSKKAKKDVSTMFDMFDGLQQRMLNLKVPKEFRDMIMGMSAEDFNELAKLTGKKAIFKFKKGKPKTKSNIESLTPTGNAMMKTYREAQLGEANLVNRETVAEIADKEKAFRILIANGVNATEALNQVEDAALAAAIASGALGKKGSKEMKQYIEDLKKANSELERFNLKQNMIRKNEEFKLLEQMPKLMTAMKSAGMSADQMASALEDPALAKHLIEDLKDGKVDAKEIADFLNSIEARKIIDIQVNYNAGKYGDAAQPGIDAAEQLFSALEGGIRNGIEGFSSAQNKIDVATIQKNNKLIAEAELKATGFRHQIELINREIRGMERDIELNYTRPIEDATEKISDMERELEMNPIFGDRAIGKLNDENTKLSNDLAIMANQADKINERYDKQAEALQKVADINDGIIAQQQSQLDLADALTQGDISAAARVMQQSRADQASRNQTGMMDALEQARTNELEGLRGAESGLSQLQIAERQFVISQEIYKMENNPARLKIMADILALQDKIYDFEEGREAALLKIRDKEDAIYKINKEQLWPLEDSISDMQYENDMAQRRLDIDVSNLTVLGKSREEFEKMKAEIALNEVAAKNLTAVFGGMLAAIEAIRAKWGEVIAAITAAQNAASAQAAADAIKKKAADDQAAVDAEKAAAIAATAQAQTGAKSDSAAFAASQKAAVEYAVAKAAGDMNAALIAAAKVIPSALAAGESGAIGAASITAQLKAAEKSIKVPSASSAIAARRARDGYLSSGGIVPKYFAAGGFAMGTDTVPAMLTPGEFVMSKYAVQSYGIDKMKAINSGSSVGDSVYNYSINVNVESEANPDEIARVVMTQIRNIDGQKLRGTRI